jgi:hypothetical protein
VAVGVGVGALVVGLGITLVALPLFAFARAVEPDRGIDRPFVHTGLVLAIPVGVVLGVAVGSATGWWYRRGGRVPGE